MGAEGEGPLPPLTGEEYEALKGLPDTMQQTSEAISNPELAAELGDGAAMLRAYMDGYEATHPDARE